MLIVRISDQLGNQMFAYASVKTIAETGGGYEFGFVRAQNDLVNDTDEKYGNEIHTIFPNVKKEFLEKIPESIIHVYEDPPVNQRIANYQKPATEVSDNTLMIGHFVSYKYFSDNIENVWKWFAFPLDIETTVQAELERLQQKYSDRPLVAVHFRVGKDYTSQGFLLRKKYWFRAAEKIVQESTNTPVFLLFYDQKKSIINEFIRKYDCEICRGSLIHDLCMMSKCRKQIICNSSFSIMSAVLNQNSDKEIFRPSVYPVGLYFYPLDCFAEDWRVIPAKQSILSYFICVIVHVLNKYIIKQIKKLR